VAVQGLARTIPPWHRVPLTARAEDIKNTGHHSAWLGTRTSTNVFAVLAASTQPRSRFRNKGFDSFPETIGKSPTGHIFVSCRMLYEHSSNFIVLILVCTVYYTL